MWIEEAAIRAATLARQAGVPVTSDIDRVTDRTPELVAAVSIPIFAEHVLPAITGEADYERALTQAAADRMPACCASRSGRAAP